MKEGRDRAARSALTTARAVANGAVGPHAPAAAAIQAIRARESGTGALNAFISVADPDGLPSIPDGGPLSGVPVAVKDNLSTVDLPTTCGSNVLDGYRAPFDATVVRRLRQAGALIVGKTNMDEFGMGSSSENSAFGVVQNPVAPGRVPGGSSGGSAAAVAAGDVPIALGSDTGGSVRQPAAFCGIVGIKPTYGRVSRYGLVAFASSLEQVGTFGRNVTDAALALGVIAGHDPRDATSVERPVPDYVEAVGRGIEGLTVGVPAEYLPDELDAGVRARFEEALRQLESGGATVMMISLPHTHLAIPAYYVLAPAEASSNLARFDGVRFGQRGAEAEIGAMYGRTRERFGPEVRRRILLGTYVLSAGYYDAYYGTAQRARGLIAADFEAAFAQVDVIFTPTAPTTAFRIGSLVQDPLAMYLSDVFTVPANLAGIPGMSVPIGAVDGLPVGGQLLAPWWDEETMLAAAGRLEAGKRSGT